MRDRHRKPILKLNINTGEVLKEYAAAKDAKIDGFSGACLSVACRNGTKYKGFLWKFKT